MKNLLKVSVLIVGLINYVLAQGLSAGGGIKASVGGSDNAGPSGSASGSASIDCDPISDGLPSCACLSGSISVSAEGSVDGVAEGSASLSVDPGVNCIDNAGGDEPDDFITYETDVERNSMTIQYNSYIKMDLIVQSDANITYLEAITEEQPLKINMAMVNWLPDKYSNPHMRWKEVWEWNEKNSLKNACDDSFPEGTVEYIIFDILNKMIYNEQGCPVSKGSVFTMVPWLRSYQMKFEKPISCGSYSLDISLATPVGRPAGRIWFDWDIPKDSNCLPDFQPIQ